MSNQPAVNQDVPSLVLDYFGQPKYDQVQLVQLYGRNGWLNVGASPATWQTMLALYDARVATKFAVRLASDANRVADFDMEELLRYARRGMCARPAYANRQPVAA